MDPETEKRLAALIMEEAARLRMHADTEGVHVYLSKPRIRGRPNSQFLQATVRSIQQANRVVEVNEMWRRREKEMELERAYQRQHERTVFSTQRRGSREMTRKGALDRHNKEEKGCLEYESGAGDHHHEDIRCSAVNNRAVDATDSSSPYESGHSYKIPEDVLDEGLNDDEVESFLRSRAKRGRGAIGSRMDEPGPYPLPQAGDSFHDVRFKEDWQQRIIGPAAGPSNVIQKVDESKENKRRKKKHRELEGVEGMISKVKLKKRHDKAKHRKEKKKRKHESQERVSKKKKYHDAE